jgi:hypothetical protein
VNGEEPDWTRLLFTLLAEHDDDLVGERLAVLDFHVIHRRWSTKGEPMTDATRRALRTLLQFIAAGGLTAFVDEVVAKISDGRLTALVLAGSLLLVTYAQNWLEDNTTFPALLKAPPSPGVNPVLDGERGAAGLAMAVAAGVGIAFFVIVATAVT